MPRGGARPGAGRPRGQGKYGTPTKSVRVPVAIADAVVEYARHRKQPVYGAKVQAGFPSPADDHVMTGLDIRQYLVKHPAATFFVRVSGDSMIGAGIHDGDLLVVDKSLEPVHGRVVIAAVEGDLTVKRLVQEKGKVLLMPENADFSPLDITANEDVTIWGVVTNVIHAV